MGRARDSRQSDAGMLSRSGRNHAPGLLSEPSPHKGGGRGARGSRADGIVHVLRPPPQADAREATRPGVPLLPARVLRSSRDLPGPAERAVQAALAPHPVAGQSCGRVSSSSRTLRFSTPKADPHAISFGLLSQTFARAISPTPSPHPSAARLPQAGSGRPRSRTPRRHVRRRSRMDLVTSRRAPSISSGRSSLSWFSDCGTHASGTV